MRFSKYVNRAETTYYVSDRLHDGRTVTVAGCEIATIVSAWLAELGAHSPWWRTWHGRRATATGRPPARSPTSCPWTSPLRPRSAPAARP